MTEIAFLGLGSLGAATASRLIDAGHRLTVWNRTPDKATPLTERGAVAAASPAEAVAAAEVVITLLTDGDAVERVLFGPEGAVNGLRPGTVLVEMSTIGPEALRALRERLPHGIGLVDAPVMGGPAIAAQGGLGVLAGGEDADLDRVAPLLSDLGAVTRCGALGNGAALKLVVNLSILNSVAAVAEALALGESLGLPEDLLVHVLENGPIGGAARRARDTSGDFKICLAAKDLRLATAARGLPVTDAVLAWLAGADQNSDIRTLTKHAKDQ